MKDKKMKAMNEVEKNQEKSMKEETRRIKKIKREMKTTFDWIDIENVTDRGIFLKKDIIRVGLKIEPEGIFLKSTAEKNIKIDNMTMAIKDIQKPIYITMPKTRPELDDVFNRYVDRQANAGDNENLINLTQLELEGIDMYESVYKDIAFYWIISTNEKNYDDDLKELKKIATHSKFNYSQMTLTDYNNVILEKFQNPMINNFYIPTLNLQHSDHPTVPPTELSKTPWTNRFTKSKLAPLSFKDRETYYEIGDRYETVYTILDYPRYFYVGLLALQLSNPNIRVEIKIEPNKFDVNKFMTNRINQLNQEFQKASDDIRRKAIVTEIDGISNTIKRNNSLGMRCLNVMVNIILSASSMEELENMERELNQTFSPLDDWRIIKLRYVQQNLFKETSPLFIDGGLRKDQRENYGTVMTAESFCGLYPYIFESLDDDNGSLIGYERTTGGHIVFNPFLYSENYNEAQRQNRTNNNIFIAGSSGSGKTTFVKKMLMQQYSMGNRIIYIDPENALQNFSKTLDAIYIDWKTNKYMINPFDLKPIAADGEDDDSLIYDTKQAIDNNIEDIKILYRALHNNISDEELAVLDSVVNLTYIRKGIDPENENFTYRTCKHEDYPTFTDLNETIYLMENQARKIEKTYEANILNKLKIKTNPFVNSYAKFFDGHTNFDESKKVIFFGVKEAQNKSEQLMVALNRIVFQKAWSSCLDMSGQAVLAFDESHKYILQQEVASSFAQFARRARKYRASVWFITQQTSDYNEPSIQVHGNAIINNCTYKFLMLQQTAKEIKLMAEQFDLNESEIAQISVLSIGGGLFILGNRKFMMQVFVTQRQLNLM